MKLKKKFFKLLKKIFINIRFFCTSYKYKFDSGLDFDKLSDQFNVLNFKPFIGTKDFFLSRNECDYIKSISKEKLERSKVHYQNNKKKNVSNLRSSSSYLMNVNEDKVVFNIIKRISNLIGLDSKLIEYVEVSLYEEGQFFAHHLDSYNKEYILEKIENKNKFLQRVFTVICYLNTPEDGGITSFPNLNKKVFPAVGKLLAFENTKRNTLSTNYDSLHGGDPVFKGEKWILSTWFFNN